MADHLSDVSKMIVSLACGAGCEVSLVFSCWTQSYFKLTQLRCQIVDFLLVNPWLIIMHLLALLLVHFWLDVDRHETLSLILITVVQREGEGPLALLSLGLAPQCPHAAPSRARMPRLGAHRRRASLTHCSRLSQMQSGSRSRASSCGTARPRRCRSSQLDSARTGGGGAVALGPGGV